MLPIPSATKAARGHYLDLCIPRDQFAFVGNAGIVLDHQFILVDFDLQDPMRDEWVAKMPATWKQLTPHGEHWLYRVPAQGWFKGFKLLSGGRPIGDVKTKGYLIGPGSMYEKCPSSHGEGVTCLRSRKSYDIVDARDPVLAPEWLLKLAASTESHVLGVDGDGLAGIPPGLHDIFLNTMAFTARKHFNLGEDALAAFLRNMLPLLENVDPADPFDEDYIARKARHIHTASAEPMAAPTRFALGRTDEDVGERPARSTWLVLPGFIPSAGLTLLWGDGKIGKSTWAAWLVAEATKTGKAALFIGSGEETFESFVQKARLGNLAGGMLHEWPMDKPFRLPGSEAMLEEALDLDPRIGLVYVDAAYSHAARQEGSHAGERARAVFGPLGAVAQKRGIAIVATIHENAGGALMGSRESRNVARSSIHAVRKPGGDLTLWPDGGNGWQPDYGITFPGTPHPILEADGAPRAFVDLFGDRIEATLWSLRLGEKIPLGGTAISSADIAPSPEQRVCDYLSEHPEASNKEIAAATELSVRTVAGYAVNVRACLDSQAKQ